MFGSYKDKLKYAISKEQFYHPSSSLAIIQRVYPEKYTCDIMIVEPTNSRVGHEAKNVLIPFTAGLTYALPHPGDKVIVNFLNGDVQYPYIVQTYVSNPLQLINHTTIVPSTMEHLSELR